MLDLLDSHPWLLDSCCCFFSSHRHIEEIYMYALPAGWPKDSSSSMFYVIILLVMLLLPPNTSGQ